MNLYNLLFGMNWKSDILLAILGLKRVDVQRFRDAYTAQDCTEITVYTRTGGGNREGYPNLVMRAAPGWLGSVDDDFDSTYCTDRFTIPEQWREDVRNFGDVSKGFRAEFSQFILKTLNRTPTPADVAQDAHDAERRELERTQHQMANGHTFVPLSDHAMEVALKVAEANEGKLRSALGILPLTVVVRRNFNPYPNARDLAETNRVERVDVGYEWIIDDEYWAHCKERFTAQFPKSMAAIAEEVEEMRGKAEGRT